MNIIFKEEALSELYVTGKTNDKKYKKLCKNKRLIDGYVRVVNTLYNVESTEELKVFRFLHYEKLRHQKDKPISSVRLVNGLVERLLFSETDDGIEVELIVNIMATRNNRLVPVRAIHPGEILREELQERGIKQKDFAKQIGVQATHLNAFIRGKRNLNDDLAMKLERHLGIPYKTWINLHSGFIYDSKAVDVKQSEEQEAREYEDTCASIFNLKLLYKKLNLSHLPCIERVTKLKALFAFDLRSSKELSLQVAGLYKHSEKVHIDEKNMQTWLILNWLEISRATIETRYQKGNGLKAASEIAEMANNRTLSAQGIKDCLNKYGIAYLNVEKLDKTPVDAYSTLVDGCPVITVTYRYNDIDKLAFDVLHELCHIERHLSEDNQAFISTEGTLYSKDPREKEANDFARQQLIPDDVWSRIIGRGCKSLLPHKVVNAIAKEAERYGISPSIAVSRYKHDTNRYQTSVYKSPKIS